MKKSGITRNRGFLPQIIDRGHDRRWRREYESLGSKNSYPACRSLISSRRTAVRRYEFEITRRLSASDARRTISKSRVVVAASK